VLFFVEAFELTPESRRAQADWPSWMVTAWYRGRESAWGELIRALAEVRADLLAEGSEGVTPMD